MAAPDQDRTIINSLDQDRTIKLKLFAHKICDKIKNNTIFEKVCGFQFDDIKTWEKLVKLLHRPSDPSSLAVARILFGLLMMIDVLDERGFGNVDVKWGDETDCRFPLFDSFRIVPLHWMCILYMMMCASASGIMLGCNYKMSCFSFASIYWYILLLDKTSWNNHSYMFGVLVILFMATDSHSLWSVDAYLNNIDSNSDIPLWNYGILRFQLFLLYFYAGLKKTDTDWIQGYSMASLANHWIFYPLKYIFNLEQIDLWIVHIFGFLIDITVGFLIYFDKTRAFSFSILTCFHIMNSQMFHIGMFPFVCLATMTLFCGFNWPRRFISTWCPCLSYLIQDAPVKNPNCYYREEDKDGTARPKKMQHLAVFLLYAHVLIQLFLPYSHFITKGYNNWTNGLYGYSWDMMVHTWDTSRVTIKVVDNDTNKTMFVDPEAWVQNSRWQRHADMVVQYSKCVKRNLKELKQVKNPSVYVDVWVSLNKRFHQRLFDPRVDILTAHWSPFERVTWVMPLLEEFTPMREKIEILEKEVHSWSNSSDALFMADFPGFDLENYVHRDLENVTLTVLEGKLSVEVGEVTTPLYPGESMNIPPAVFHSFQTVSSTPSAFMYTYSNKTKALEPPISEEEMGPTLLDSINAKYENFVNAVALSTRAMMRILNSTPMIKKIKVGGSDTINGPQI